jgi:hypothetical protein
MKKQVLFLATMLIGLTSATASTTVGYTVSHGEDFNTTPYRYAEPIVFIERGVEFLIFPDGSFDFNTEIANNISNVYYRSNTRRSSLNTTYGAPATGNRICYSTPIPRGVIITHDANGLVRRIGNVFINYNRQGQIKRAGSVYMSYHRGNGSLIQVGGLRVNYNPWGQIVHASGFVNHFNTGVNGGFGSEYNGNNFFSSNDVENYNENYYYYRRNGEIKKTKKNSAFKQS